MKHAPDPASKLEAFFRNGRTVIVPVDHGTAIPVPGLEDPASLMASLAPFADGFVVNAGMARAHRAALAGKGVCLRTDVYKPAASGAPDLGSWRVFDSHDAAAMGAQAVMNMLYPHHPNEAAMTRDCAELVRQRGETGIPVILEALPLGIGRPDEYTPEGIGFAVRQAWELGADVVKTAYPGDEEAFRAIVEACPVPVVVLGGAAAHDDAGVLGMVAAAMRAGAKGVAIGRNVWQRDSPAAMAKALHRIVHEDASAEDALVALRAGD